MKIISTGLTEWENRHEIFKEKINDLRIAANEPALDALESYNDCTKGFQKLIAEAIQAKTPFRSLGAGWSWSKIATAKNGLMVDTKQLNTTMKISAPSVVPTYTGDVKKLFFLRNAVMVCGNLAKSFAQKNFL